MADKTFILKMEDEYVCMLRRDRDKELVCSLEDAMDPVTFRDNCKGNLNDRPDWCPLIEINPADEVKK